MVAWIENYAQIIAFFIQMLFYITVAVSACWAAITFARYVKFMTSAEPGLDSEPVAPDKSVEMFVD